MIDARRKSWVILLALIASMSGIVGAVAQDRLKHFETSVQTEIKPWTHLNFYDDPKNFKFAIMSDRAGGVRPGVFKDAAEKLNLIMPEFVMSVGDFIPGNKSDRAQLAKEWAEFDDELKPLKPPFFFVPGNHDINNDVMREVWNERSGVPYYWFVYKDVLFLALDSTGEKGEIIPDAQVELMEKALEKFPEARWIFVFLHHPLWLYDSPSGFAKVEKLLEGRKYTVIAGHLHRYLQDWRNNTNYYVLASTGGGSELRGHRYGEFDHVTLVTVTDEGPIIANLRLDGILPHDVTKRSDYELIEALARSADLQWVILTDNETAVKDATIYLTLRNPSKRNVQVRAQFGHGHEVQMEPAKIEETLPPRSRKVVEIAVRSSEAISIDVPALLQLDWAVGYNLADKDELVLSGTHDIPLKPSNINLIRTVAPEFVKSLPVAFEEPREGFTTHYTTDGTAPTTKSPKYDRQFVIDDTTTVKGRTFNAVGQGSATVSQHYKRVPGGKGLRYQIYQGAWTRMPRYNELTPVFESVASDLNVESRQLWADNWGMVLEGNFEVDSPGKHTFFLNSDDGSNLYIDDELVIDNDGDHSLLELSGEKVLSAGTHKIRIEFFESGGEAILELDVAAPGRERQPFAVDSVTH